MKVYYLTGFQQPNSLFGMNFSTKEIVLGVEEQDEEYEIWCGPALNINDCKEKLEIENMYFLS
jgi:hypothetical protein